MLTVDFTGTPLSGEEPLSVVFTSTVTVTQDEQPGGGSKKKKGRRPKTYAEAAYEEVKNLALETPQVAPIAEQESDDELILALARVLH